MTNKISQKLYNGEIELDFYPDSHRYKLAGQSTYLISVTAITGILDKSRVLINWAVNTCTIPYIKQFLDEHAGEKFTAEELYPVLDEAAKQHEIRKQKAATIGDLVHDFAEKFVLYKTGQIETMPELPEDENAKNGVNAFLDWFMSHDVKFEAAERLVYSKKYGFVGTTDGIATIDGKKYLIDYKTGSGVYNEHYLQVTGYRLAYEEEMKEKLDGALILHFNKDNGSFSSPKFISDFDHEANTPAFLACYEIKKRDKELNKLTY